MTRTISDLPFVNYEEDDFQRDPFEWLSQTAKHTRLARSLRGVEIFDYQMCRKFLVDRTFGTDHANLVEKMGLPAGRALDYKRRMLLTQNRGKTRTRIRNALLQLVGPAQSDLMRDEIAKVVSRLLNSLQHPEVDLKHDFADLVPAGVYCHWVDAPLEDARFVADSSEAVLAIFRRDPDLTPGIVEAYDRLFDHVKIQINKRRSNLGSDFLSRLIKLREAGGLSEEELEDFAVMLIEASTDNTAHQIAIAIDRLTGMPDLWRAIGKDRSLASSAVRECMRLWPRSISTSRVALEDTQLGDVDIAKGTTVFASFGAAHRQPDVFDDPHRFDPDRPALPPHLNFGGGAFSCLGQFVANIEVEEAVFQLSSQYPRLKPKKVNREFTAMFQMISSMPVDLIHP